MLSSRLPPTKPPRMKIVKAANKFDAAQLKTNSTIASCINRTSNANNNININDENHLTMENKKNYTTNTIKAMPLTGQLSADKAVMAKRKHLHFHSPLIKSPLKNATEALVVIQNQQNQQQHQQQHQQQQQQQENQQRQQQQNNEQELPRLLFAGIESNKAARVNLALTTETTATTNNTTTATLTKGTVATSNIATILHLQQNDNHLHRHRHQYHHHQKPNTYHENQHKHQHQHQHRHNHNHDYNDDKYGTMNTAMNVKVIGNMIARKRLDRGCSSLMYACQHGDIKEVLDQIHNKVYSLLSNVKFCEIIIFKKSLRIFEMSTNCGKKRRMLDFIYLSFLGIYKY